MVAPGPAHPGRRRTGRAAGSWAVRLLRGTALLALTAFEIAVVAVVVGSMAGQARTFSAAVGWSGQPGVFRVAGCAVRDTGRDRTRTCTGVFRPDGPAGPVEVGRLDTGGYLPGDTLPARLYAGDRVTRTGARAALGAAGPFLLSLAVVLVALAITLTWLLPASVRFRLRAETSQRPRLSRWTARAWICLFVAGVACLVFSLLGP